MLKIPENSVSLRSMKIYVKQLDDKGNRIEVKLPKQGSEVAAGYDVVATSEPKIVGNKVTPVGFETNEIGNEWSSIDYIEYETNLFIAPAAQTFHTLIHPRSSVSKYNLVLANSIGLVDNDYRGMVICRFKYVWQPEDMWWGGDGNTRKSIFASVNMTKIYKKGDAIAQLVVEPTVMVEWVFADDLSNTARGTGGFGSTDSKVKSGEQLASIVEKYKRAGGVPTPLPYSEQIKQRPQ
jgi:dUTPase